MWIGATITRGCHPAMIDKAGYLGWRCRGWYSWGLWDLPPRLLRRQNGRVSSVRCCFSDDRGAAEWVEAVEALSSGRGEGWRLVAGSGHLPESRSPVWRGCRWSAGRHCWPATSVNKRNAPTFTNVCWIIYFFLISNSAQTSVRLLTAACVCTLLANWKIN